MGRIERRRCCSWHAGRACQQCSWTLRKPRACIVLQRHPPIIPGSPDVGGVGCLEALLCRLHLRRMHRRLLHRGHAVLKLVQPGVEHSHSLVLLHRGQRLLSCLAADKQLGQGAVDLTVAHHLWLVVVGWAGEQMGG